MKYAAGRSPADDAPPLGVGGGQVNRCCPASGKPIDRTLPDYRELDDLMET